VDPANTSRTCPRCGHCAPENRPTQADFACAVQLAERFGFALNDRARFDLPAVVPTSAGTAVFATSHLGLYDRVLRDHTPAYATRVLQMDGQGAGLLKGGYRYRSRTQLRDWMLRGTPDKADHAEARLTASMSLVDHALLDLDVDPDSPDASEWHYASYRAGLHGGSAVPLHLTNLRPLQQLQMVAMGHWPDRAEGSPENVTFTAAQRGMTDLLILLDPELASHPFAAPRPPLSRAVIEERLAALGGPLTDEEVPRYTITGSQEKAGGGPHSLGAGIARSWEIHDVTRDDIIARSRPWVDAIADVPLRESYERIRRLTAKELAKSNDRQLSDGSSPAKLLSAVLLAGG
jgi:hypothetical protein